MFDEIIGQANAVRTLKGLFQTAESGAFVLLHGPAGVGKATAATRMVQHLVCQASSPVNCSCLVCRAPSEHPDVIYFEPEKNGASIKIEQVREAMIQANYPPVSGRYRAWFIHPMEMLTIAAANALLRLLEAPPKALWIIAVAHNLSAVPITLRSRAFKVPFQLLDNAAMLQIGGDQVDCNAGSMSRGALLGDKKFKSDLQKWDGLIGQRYYNPDAVVKFARAVGSKGRTLADFVESLLLVYRAQSVAAAGIGPYNGSLQQMSRAGLDSYLSEREVLQQALVDLRSHVNPAFVCEDAIRNIRRIRKSLKNTS